MPLYSQIYSFIAAFKKNQKPRADLYGVFLDGFGNFPRNVVSLKSIFLKTNQIYYEKTILISRCFASLIYFL